MLAAVFAGFWLHAERVALSVIRITPGCGMRKDASSGEAFGSRFSTMSMATK
jgi:hypothetical protein